MALSAQERTALIDRYARGPASLKAALAQIPPDALKWRPEPKRWSAHEIIVHCADSESNAHMRLRYLLAEDKPVIQATTRTAGPRGSTTTPSPSTPPSSPRKQCGPTRCPPSVP